MGEQCEPLLRASPLEQIRHLQHLGILHRELLCLFCTTPMHLRPSKQTCDGYAWECCHAECSKRKTTRSIRFGSVFAGSKVTLPRLFKIICLWYMEIQVGKIPEFVDVSRRTAIDMYARLQYVVITAFDLSTVRLGGSGIICQIDESLFSHKAKNHVGRVPEEPIWVFGICDTSTTPAKVSCRLCLTDPKKPCCQSLLVFASLVPL